MSWKEVHFTEIIVSKADDIDNEYQICEDELHKVYNIDDEVTRMQRYNQALVLRLNGYPKGRIQEFIYYHLNLADNPKGWLWDLEHLFETRRKDMDGFLFYNTCDKVLEIIEKIRDSDQVIGSPKKIQNKKERKSVSVPNSFTYKQLPTNPEKLNDLCDSLKKNNFIEQDTNLANFKKIFSGKEVNSPVVWSGSPSEFAYFIKLIHNIHQYVENLKQKQWKVAVKCFVDIEGKPFPKAIRKLNKPKLSSELIEKCVNHLD